VQQVQQVQEAVPTPEPARTCQGPGKISGSLPVQQVPDLAIAASCGFSVLDDTAISINQQQPTTWHCDTLAQVKLNVNCVGL
jgi:hypothetical protein